MNPTLMKWSRILCLSSILVSDETKQFTSAIQLVCNSHKLVLLKKKEINMYPENGLRRVLNEFHKQLKLFPRSSLTFYFE